jgi:hypothetical protein
MYDNITWKKSNKAHHTGLFCYVPYKRLCLILTGNSSSTIHVKNIALRREEISNFSFVPTFGISFTYSSNISNPVPLRNFMYAFDAYRTGIISMISDCNARISSGVELVRLSPKQKKRCGTCAVVETYHINQAWNT